MKFTAMKPETAIIGVLILGAAYFAYKAKSSLGETFDLVANSDMVTGLTHPIESLSALFSSPEQLQKKYAGTLSTTENFQNYIDANGGNAAYIAAHQNGTFSGAPYDASKTYPKKYNPLSVFNL